MSDIYQSRLIENIVSSHDALHEAAKAAGLSARSCRGIAREEMRLVVLLDKRDRYSAVRAFLAKLAQL